jgi:hypothetical protein
MARRRESQLHRRRRSPGGSLRNDPAFDPVVAGVGPASVRDRGRRRPVCRASRIRRLRIGIRERRAP